MEYQLWGYSETVESMGIRIVPREQQLDREHGKSNGVRIPGQGERDSGLKVNGFPG